ncbi:hypothetical protein ACJJTC_002773, partial [Scirpophaga incertulas]
MALQMQTLNEIDRLNIASTVLCDAADLHKHFVRNINDLTIISQNICSIYCNFDELLLTLCSLTFEIDIIILTECHLNPHKPIPKLNNYNSYHTTNHLNKNDGVTVYIRDTLACTVKEIKITDASCLELVLANYTIICIYRSPSNKHADNFTTSLGAHLETLITQKNIIIA